MRFVAALVLLVVCSLAVHAQPLVAPLKPPELPAMEQTFSPGLRLEVHSQNSKASVIQQVRLPAIYVAPDAPPAPIISAGPFRATWSGFINLRIRGQYTFMAQGRGSVKITVNDAIALEAAGDDLFTKPGVPLKLTKGRNKLTVEYSSPMTGPSEFRALWAGDFPAEPITPGVLTFDASDAAFRQSQRVLQGRELFATLRCIKCHRPDASVNIPPNAMQEITSDAPDLSEVGSRLKSDWVAQWIADPRSFNPRAEMPQIFATQGGQIPQQVADIAACLATLRAATAEAGGVKEDQAASGARVYAILGCIGCHTPPDFAGRDEVLPPRVPHSYVAQKYQPKALREFLKAPESRFNWIRMPNFRLNEQELDGLVAYLTRAGAERRLSPLIKGDAARGRGLLASSGCLNCHAAKGAASTARPPDLTALSKSPWTRGCVALDASARGSAPNFSFTDDQRAALMSFAATDLMSWRTDSSIDAAERQFASLNCIACHNRDKIENTWSALSKENDAITARLPQPPPADEHLAPDQSRPPLTWVGMKLRPQWMEQFIAGKVPYKPRPWIAARMPGFPTRAPILAAGFSADHGYPGTAPSDPAPDAKLATIGQKLVGKAGGFSCNNCHAIASAPALAPFEAPAPNFSHVKERLREPYYHWWVRNPQRVEPGTRMPTFINPDGTTALKDVLGGDGAKQFDAIWNYLLDGAEIHPPNQ